MVRLTSELIDDSKQYINAVNDRELNLRGCKIPAIENLGGTRVRFQLYDLYLLSKTISVKESHLSTYQTYVEDVH